jgi:hypothetical protein
MLLDYIAIILALNNNDWLTMIHKFKAFGTLRFI